MIRNQALITGAASGLGWNSADFLPLTPIFQQVACFLFFPYI
jgi:hypothetical protein